jgi:putative flippase GtrA
LSTTKRQFLKYIAVGLLSNFTLYGFYLVLANTAFEPKTAMTITYAFGVSMTYLFNRRWTFNHQGSAGFSLIRYIAVYALGYLINLSALIILVDYSGFSHEIVQGTMIILLAVILFVLQKYWVFRVNPKARKSCVQEISTGAGQ